MRRGPGHDPRLRAPRDAGAGPRGCAALLRRLLACFVHGLLAAACLRPAWRTVTDSLTHSSPSVHPPSLRPAHPAHARGGGRQVRGPAGLPLHGRRLALQARPRPRLARAWAACAHLGRLGLTRGGMEGACALVRPSPWRRLAPRSLTRPFSFLPRSHDTSTTRGWWEADAARRQEFYSEVLGGEGTPPAQCTPAVLEHIVQQVGCGGALVGPKLFCGARALLWGSASSSAAEPCAPAPD